MTAQTADVYPDNVRPDYTDEIDLRAYLLVLLQWWREILVITFLAGAVAGVGILILDSTRTPIYAASADVIIVRLSSNIQLDDRVNTTSSAVQTDLNTWRASLLELVKSSAVANQVQAELANELPAALQTPGALLRTISAEIPLSPDGRSASNLIRVTAATTDPELSARIANSWTQHLVTHINALYGEVPEVMIASVVTERDESFLAYQTAQEDLEEFVGNNQIDVLTRQIQEKQTLRDELILNYQALMTAVVSTDYNARLQLYRDAVAAPAQHTWSIVAAQMQSDIDRLELLYALRSSATTQLDQARNMERSLVEGGEAAAKSNVSALQLLKLAAFATLQVSERAPGNISLVSPVQDIEMSLEEQLADVRALVTVFEEYVVDLDGEIELLAETQVAGSGSTAFTSMQDRLDAQTELAGADVEDVDADFAATYAQLLTPGSTLEQLPAEISSAFIANHETLVTQLENEIRSLQATLSAEEARQRQLTHQRDQAWTTYEAVGTKLQELNMLRSSANSEVRLGNPALPPSQPLPQMDLLLPVAAATFAGFFFAILLALLVNSLGGTPFFARRPA